MNAYAIPYNHWWRFSCHHGQHDMVLSCRWALDWDIFAWELIQLIMLIFYDSVFIHTNKKYTSDHCKSTQSRVFRHNFGNRITKKKKKNILWWAMSHTQNKFNFWIYLKKLYTSVTLFNNKHKKTQENTGMQENHNQLNRRKQTTNNTEGYKCK